MILRDRIGGQLDYAYDAASLLRLNASNLTNVLFNFHPYMGPNQQSDTQKSAYGFEAQILQLVGTRPLIVTEFGQYCCPSDGVCYSYPGSYDGHSVGYVEAILQICAKHSVSWLGWAWRPQATDAVCDSPDMNGESGDPLKLSSASKGIGAPWARLFAKYF